MASRILLSNYFWIAPHVILAFIAVTMIWRGFTRTFPWFLAYTVYELAQFITLFSLYDSYYMNKGYYYSYLTGGLLSDILRFAVLYEVFAQLFRNYPSMSGLGRLLYRGVAAVLLLTSVALVAATAGETSSYLSLWVDVIDRAVNMVQCGLLVFLFLVSRYLRFSWRNHAFGIALGLGLFASVQLAVAALRSSLGPFQEEDVLNLVTMAAYHLSVVIWAVYFWLPDKQPTFDVEALRPNVLDGWNAALQRVFER